LVLGCYLGAHAKFKNPTTIPYGRISNEPGEKEERREKNAIYSGHLHLCQQPRAAHALRSDQNHPNRVKEVYTHVQLHGASLALVEVALILSNPWHT
jgi:hypothetical protein